MNSIQLIQNKSEIGAGTRGSSLGIDALRIASLNQKSDFFSKYETVSIKDQNHLLFEKNRTPSAIRVEGIRKVYSSVADAVKTSYSSNKFPLVLAADHARLILHLLVMCMVCR